MALIPIWLTDRAQRIWQQPPPFVAVWADRLISAQLPLWVSLVTAGLSFAASSAATLAAGPGSAKSVDYNRDIRPILSENCYACHGPDADKRKAGLRLDIREDALKALKSGAYAIVPRDSAKSELVHRITTTDEDDRMPPAKSGKSLTAVQIELLRRWVEEGAAWSGHWAYQKPERPTVPEVQNKSWARNDIDRFILARLEKEGQKPSPEADKNRLIRRATLDLTGLPPSVAEVEQFLYDNSPDAYDKLVDRLLQSTRYGERMAQDWLDLARFADSQGYHHDSHRDLWPWRDWVIQAFNDNMPFDQFTTEQVAGDLLPNATRAQRIATGFHRNEMTTSEGGAMPEEYSVKYVVGRVDTTARVWLGTSMACAECHDHKYDPITQKQFYEFFAYFNTVAENGLDQELNPVPRLVLDTPEQRQKLEQFGREIGALEKAREGLLLIPNAEQAAAQEQWSAKLRDVGVERWRLLEPVGLSATSGATLNKLLDHSVLAKGTNAGPETYEIRLRTDALGIRGLRLEALADERFRGTNTSGRGAAGDFLLTQLEVVARSAHPEAATRVPAPDFGPWYSLGPFQAATGKEAFEKSFGPENGVELSKTYEDGKLKWMSHSDWKDGGVQELPGTNAATFVYRTLQAKEAGPVILSLGSGGGLQVWWNGRRVLSKQVSRSAAPDQNRVVVWLAPGENRLLLKINAEGGGGGMSFKLLPDPVLEHAVEIANVAADYNQPDFNVRGILDGNPESGWAVGGTASEAAGSHQAYAQVQDAFGFKEGTELVVRLRFQSEKSGRAQGRFRVALTSAEGLGDFIGLTDPVRRLLLRPADQLAAAEKTELQRYYRENFVPEIRELGTLLATQRKAKQEFNDSITVTMVMQEMEKPRDTYLLVRGNFQQRGEKVAPGVPSSLFPMPAGYPTNRLGLAKWLTHPDHPLVSRVTVNHFWQHYFGTGLVKTAEDFGSQGEWPSHPELLDWLATEFVRTKWDIKAMQRLIVTSATYRQAATVSAEGLQRDPDNRLLGRFPRLRLDAECIRDNALAISGLLNSKIGGPSAYPYQPPGLWEAVAFEGTRKYEQSQGAENYRRGLYTYWRRSLPYPSLITFDAPVRETCTVRRPRTNTPLQALTLMNDPVYVEAARVFGQRILREGGGTLDSRIDYAVRVCLGRSPSKAERNVLEKAYREHLATFEQNRVSAAKLLNIGASSPPIDLDPCELATWTLLGTTLLNLDETITKG